MLRVLLKNQPVYQIEYVSIRRTRAAELRMRYQQLQYQRSHKSLKICKDFAFCNMSVMYDSDVH